MSIPVDAPYWVSDDNEKRCLEFRHENHDEHKWLPNDVFEATFRFTGNLIGKSGNRFEVIDIATGNVYNIFPSDMIQYIMGGAVAEGRISGRWQVIRRNTAYGIQLAV